jgi:hypothetical protein
MIVPITLFPHRPRVMVSTHPVRSLPVGGKVGCCDEYWHVIVLRYSLDSGLLWLLLVALDQSTLVSGRQRVPAAYLL